MEITAAVIFIVAVALFVFVPKAAGNASSAPVESDQPTKAVSIEETIRRAAVANNEDQALMLAIAKKESSFVPTSSNPKDPSYGLFGIETPWLKYFGYSNDPAQLYDPAFSAQLAAQILQYFRGRQNPLTGDYFQFPAEIDIYNVGETLWREGRRNLGYRDTVTSFYRSFGGTA